MVFLLLVLYPWLAGALLVSSTCGKNSGDWGVWCTILAERRRSTLGTRIATLGVGAVRGGTPGVGGALGAAPMLPSLETLGARIGGFFCRAGGLATLAMIRPSLLTVVTKREDRRCGGAGAGNVRYGWRGLTGVGEVAAGGVAACPNSVRRRVNFSREDSPRLWGRLPLMASANLPAAAMTASSGVTVGVEMYLCL